MYVCMCVCILSDIGGQNDKVYLKNFKLFRIIQKKNSLIFFKISPLDHANHPPL